MIIITMYGLLFALSIEGILTDEARVGGARNLERSRRSDSEVDVVYFLSDPLSHPLVKDLGDQDSLTLFANGSMILRGIRYDEHCLPSLGNQVIGSLYPRFQDCRTYLVQKAENLLSERSCPRNAIFNPTTSSCVIFKNTLVPGNCLQECPDDYKPVHSDDTVPHFYCDQYNPDGTERPSNSKFCIPATPKQANTRRNRMLNSLPTGYPEDSSGEFGPADYKNDTPELNLRLKKRHLQEKLDEPQRKERVKSKSVTSKLPTSKKSSTTPMGDSLHTSTLTRSKRSISTKKLVTNNDELPKITLVSAKKKVSGDESMIDVDRFSREVSEEGRKNLMKPTKKSGRPSNSHYVKSMKLVSDDGSVLGIKKMRVATEPRKPVGRNDPKYVDKRMSDVSNDVSKSKGVDVHEPLRYSRHNYS